MGNSSLSDSCSHFYFQTHNQKFFRKVEIPWNKGNWANISDIFLQEILKTAFWMRNLSYRWTQSGYFFSHSIFKKGRGGLPLPTSLYLPLLAVEQFQTVSGEASFPSRKDITFSTLRAHPRSCYWVQWKYGKRAQPMFEREMESRYVSTSILP